MTTLKEITAVSISTSMTIEIKLLINDLSRGLTIQKAMEAPKIFQVKKELGEGNTLKLVCAILKAFCDSIKATNTMDAADIIECSEEILNKYTHDSIKDIVLALKEAKREGKHFYNCINIAVVLEIIDAYIHKKTIYLENNHQDIKSKDGSINTIYHTLNVEAEKKIKRQEQMYEQKELNAIQSERDRLEKAVKKIDDLLNGDIK